MLSVLAVLVSERLSTQGFQQQAAGHLHRRDPGGNHDATDTCKVRKVVPSRKVCWLRKTIVTIVIDSVN